MRRMSLGLTPTPSVKWPLPLHTGDLGIQCYSLRRLTSKTAISANALAAPQADSIQGSIVVDEAQVQLHVQDAFSEDAPLIEEDFTPDCAVQLPPDELYDC